VSEGKTSREGTGRAIALLVKTKRNEKCNITKKTAAPRIELLIAREKEKGRARGLRLVAPQPISCNRKKEPGGGGGENKGRRGGKEGTGREEQSCTPLKKEQ